MGRTLSYYPFFTAVITITAIIAICSFNMYMTVRHRRSYFTANIYIVSLFTVSWLIFNMMSSAVFVLSLSKVYYQIARLSFMLMWASISVGLIVIFVWSRKNNYQNLSPNILKALSSVDDIVFVVDRDGDITHINHPKKYTYLFGNIEEINQLISFMELNCSACWKNGKGIDAIKGTAECELTFHDAKKYYILKITPIVINDRSQLGYTAVLEDISTMKESEKLLQERNYYLKQANERLSNYVRVAGALDAEKERLIILKHVQETLIYDIEKILLNLGKAKQNCFEDCSYHVVMKNLATQLREVYCTVRHAVSKIAGKEV
ncbi:transcriptional regulator [Anaerovorax odorimutans]|uniref:hypothetical protein n=1 Tax=Anaerovorax odorimutans TaxID=109327 RepID=UPI0003FBC18B|nr:hypothetical protein [Anaerovorax odorimutans]